MGRLVFSVFGWIWCLLVLASMISLPCSFAAQPAATIREPAKSQKERCAAADGYLSDSCEYWQAANRMRTDCSHLTVEAYYAAAEAAWNAIWSAPESPAVVEDATNAYGDALVGLLQTAREQGRLQPEGLWIGSRYRPIRIPIVLKGLPISASTIESIEPFQPPKDKRLSRRHYRPGFGLPVTIRVKPGPEGTIRGDFDPPRLSLVATAVLRFQVPGNEKPIRKFVGPLTRERAPAVLDLVEPLSVSGVHIGVAHPPVAADLSMPMLDMLEGMPKSGLEGFIMPFEGGVTEPRLEFLQPHVKGRIPVVFIHGLASDEGTWFDLINDLRACPFFQRYYEPWVYHYPTGASFLPASAMLRQSLRRIVKELDPDGEEKQLQNLVLIGHSMGGLHAKLQVVASGDHMWNAMATVPFDTVRMPQSVRAKIEPSLFFEPVTNIKRVVFIATPHQGSSLASLALGKIASLTVERPPELTAIHDQLVAENPGVLRPEFEEALPTTIQLLAPNSPLLEALYHLRPPCWVTIHNIIGVAHHTLRGERTDCVVSESSARHPGAISELDVKATHTGVHHKLTTIAEIERILRLHLVESGLRTVSR